MKKLFQCLLLFCLSIPVYAQTLNVASYNIRYDNPKDAEKGNGWASRYPFIAELVTYNDFDVWGSQEVLNHQLNDLLVSMPQYSYVGVGREDGKTAGEYAPIFFKKKQFEVLQSGSFWLSENTDYPNVGWDAVLPRVCTWVQLEDKKQNFKFWFFNLHMDHRGVVAREKSGELVLSKIRKMCGDEPVILTGDFNVDQTHCSYKLLNNSGILSDSYEKADVRYALNGTFNAFSPDRLTNSRIDHIFVTPNLNVNRYGILTDTYRIVLKDGEMMQSTDFPMEYTFKGCDIKLPSDHFPVVVRLTYNND